jgi:hypothetical protein
MSYKELIEYMHLYRADHITRTEMMLAIGLWQLSIEEGYVRPL